MKTEFLSKEFDIRIWQGEKLGLYLAFDTETTFVPFTETPDLITFQVFDGNSVYYVKPNELRSFFTVNAKANFIAHNTPFDVDVICKHVEDRNFFHIMLEEARLWDTSILYRLLHLATIGYIPPMNQWSLAYITKKFLNAELDKNEDIRLTFEKYKETTIENIPAEYLIYGANDVIATYHCFHRLLSGVRATGSTSNLSHQIQMAGSIALNRIYKRGICFDQERAATILNDTYKKLDLLSERLAMYGWVRGQKGSKERYEHIVRDFFGLDLPLTEDGSISSKSEDLAQYSDNQFVADYLEFHDLEKMTTFIRDLRHDTIHPRYNPILNTGRTSCSKPNFQQLPRSGEIRGCFIAAPESTFVITDYSAIELCTLAQITYSRYGESRMRDLLNDGKDLHRYYASVLFGKTEDAITKDERQKAKAANFGFPGGLGIETFIKFSRGYGLDLTIAEAEAMKEAWFQAFPECYTYLQENEDDEATWTLTGRKRANASYCARKNTPFQGLAADGAKIALYYLDYEGFRLRGFVHDEVITEVDLASIEADREKIEAIMIKAMQVVVPDVRISVESTISERYCK